jgi:hypothetical protein
MTIKIKPDDLPITVAAKLIDATIMKKLPVKRLLMGQIGENECLEEDVFDLDQLEAIAFYLNLYVERNRA